MNRSKETLGSRIATLRKQKNLTQEELGEKLNVSSQAVSKWENDISAPDVYSLPELSEILGVSVDELLGKKTEVDAVIYQPSKEKTDISKLMFKVRIVSVEGDKVNINLPIKLIEVFSSSDKPANINISGNDILNQINWKELLSMVEQGLLGKLVEIETVKGDTVQIFVE